MNKSQVSIQKLPKLRFPNFNDQWSSTQLSNVATFLKGSGISRDDCVIDGLYPCIRYGELYTDYKTVISKIASRTNQNTKSLIMGKLGDLLLPSSGETAWDIATASCLKVPNVIIGGDINIVRTKSINQVFLAYYIGSKKKKAIARLAQGYSVVHLYSSHLKNITLFLPENEEQGKIADFFTNIDEWIATLKLQLVELQKYKKGLLQKIFSQKKRFHDSNGVVFSKWEIKSVGDVIQEYKLKSEMNNEHPVLTSSRSGLIPQSDYYGQENRITDRDNKGFNIVPHGYITYRSRSDDGVFHFNQNNLGYTGLVSVYYPVFKNKCGSNYFLVALLNYNWKTLYKYSVGTSQKVLSLSELKKIKLFFPTAEEQERIEMLLLGVEELINNKERQIALAEQWKKGLLQQMFV